LKVQRPRAAETSVTAEDAEDAERDYSGRSAHLRTYHGPVRAAAIAALLLAFRLIAATQAQGQRMPEPPAPGDHAGFESIFDGSTLRGWDGDPEFWRAENGTIVGESTAQRPLKQNTFLIWRGGEPNDFELKVEFRINATNSGIQFRSVQVPPGGDVGRWVMKGYQADIDFANEYTGQMYEERGRGILARRGQAAYIPDGGRPREIGRLQQTDNELKALIRIGGWNQVHIVARGSTIFQILNGAVSSLVVDDDVANRASTGLIGLQMHVGPPMKVEFRNVWLRRVPR
jgi:hypothetical protein